MMSRVHDYLYTKDYLYFLSFHHYDFSLLGHDIFLLFENPFMFKVLLLVGRSSFSHYQLTSLLLVNYVVSLPDSLTAPMEKIFTQDKTWRLERLHGEMC